MLKSPVYNNGFLEHECVYEDDKNSVLISSKGDTIKLGEKFNISNLDKLETFYFYSEDLGEHNLNFTFKNSMGFIKTMKYKMLVEDEAFKFLLKPLSQEATIDTPLEIEYSHKAYDQLEHTYKVKFEVNNSYNFNRELNATLNGHKQGEWFDIYETSGTLTYIPLAIGTHEVKITSEDEKGIERIESLTIESRGTGSPIVRFFSIDELRIYGLFTPRDRSIIDHKISLFSMRLDAHSGNNKPFLKGKITIKSLGIEHNFEIKNYESEKQILCYSHDSKGQKLPENIEFYMDKPVQYELELTNSYGIKTIKKGEKFLKIEYEGRRNPGGGFRRR